MLDDNQHLYLSLVTDKYQHLTKLLFIASCKTLQSKLRSTCDNLVEQENRRVSHTFIMMLIKQRMGLIQVDEMDGKKDSLTP